ncbi:MAG: chemotaxis protein CheV, partial [Limnobacter sp.]|nr:chemotaxis protein CheV [Limnobacter sp.]
MDGCALTKLLRADNRFKNTPIVMYSSLTSAENERRGLQAGVDVYVNKFDAQKLSLAIGQLLEASPA